MDKSLSFSLPPEEGEKILSSLPGKRGSDPHSTFLVGDGFRLTMYRKVHVDGTSRLLLQGERAPEVARGLGLPLKAPPGEKAGNLYPQIGSDEVGTGDFFGPIVVVAAYVGRGDLPLLAELGVKDSKACPDSLIREVVPTLLKRIPHSRLVVSPAKLNELPYNLNEVKSRLHDAAYRHLLQRVDPPAAIYQDQFTPEKSYYRYLSSQEEEPVRGIVFETKGENRHPSVAVASMMARYAFLEKMASLDEKWGVHFPFGAGDVVERFATAFLKEKGPAALSEVGKKRFVTFSRAMNSK